MLNLSSLSINSNQVEVMAKFYELLMERPADWSDGNYFGWNAGKTSFKIGPHSDIKGNAAEPARIMIEFTTKDVKAEFERMKNNGANVIAEPYEIKQGVFISTLSDPDGNYFQIMSSWE